MTIVHGRDVNINKKYYVIYTRLLGRLQLQMYPYVARPNIYDKS